MKKTFAIILVGGGSIALTTFVVLAVWDRRPDNPFNSMAVDRLYVRPAIEGSVIEINDKKQLEAIIQELRAAVPMDRYLSEMPVWPWLVIENDDGFHVIKISPPTHDVSWRDVIYREDTSKTTPRFVFSDILMYEFAGYRWQCHVNPFRGTLETTKIETRSPRDNK